MKDKVLERIARDLQREQQARVLRELHRSATVFRDVTSLSPRAALDVTSINQIEHDTVTYSAPPGFGPVRFARHFVAEL